ncbi:hypothetical protein ACGFQG_20565 [Nocardia fluminea]|uniref:hypothetical protein n=1 Tax=Nocardia fluminea TaxID=134984 RepID=UPI00371EB10C
MWFADSLKQQLAVSSKGDPKIRFGSVPAPGRETETTIGLLLGDQESDRSGRDRAPAQS